MSYVVLARRWRPQSFEDVVGQSHITRVLRNAIRANRIAHAYLFTGVRGVGKTSAARILAKALNCENGPTPVPCNRCGQCNEISAGSAIDVYEIDGASNRGIDEVRQIIENVRYQPAKSRFKIYIIDEVHQVTKDAFNALLKTLEEPPPSVKFIMATTEPHRLPETILSRCQRFDFRRIPVREIIQRLGEICDQEGLRITHGALLLLAREAEGSMRDAQSLLEQVLSYVLPAVGEEGPKAEVNESLLQDILGVTERKILYDLSEAVIRGEPKRCLDLLADVVAQGRDLVRLSRELVEHFRNLLVMRLAGTVKAQTGADGGPFSGVNQLLDLPDQELADLKQQVAELSTDLTMDYFRVMADADEHVARSSYPQFELEAALVRLATLPKTMPVAELLERLENLEGRLSGKEETAPLKVRKDERSFAGQTPEDPVGGFSDENRPTDLWMKFVAFVMKEKKLLGSHLGQVYPTSLPPGQLVIGVEERHHLSYLQDPENLSSLRDLARRFFSGDVTVTVTASASKGQTGREGAKHVAVSAGEERGDVVKEALRIFGGSIKGVKRE